MKKQTKQIIEYTLEERDIKTINDALEYCRHRVEKHPECGAKFIPMVEITRLLNEFNE